MIAIDLHLDLAMNALYYNRDLRKTVPEMRLDEASMTEKGRHANTVSYPAMRAGDVAVSSATVIARENPTGTSSIDFRAPQMAYASAMGQLAYYRQLESEGVIRIITDRPGLDAQIRAWETDGRDRTPLGFIISMEGADPIVSPEQVPHWYDAGLRIASLVHYGVSRYAHGTGSPGGLTPLGRPMLQAMEAQKIILDVTHMADQTFFEALEIYHGPLVATHNNCRALVPGDRQFTDDQIKLIVERGGVIGAAMDNWMLYPGYVKEVTPRNVATLASVVDHIDHVCQLAGNARHAAIGTDLDGGYGTEQSPNDLDTIADLQKLPAILQGRGYSEPDVAGIMHGNWLRFFREAWA
ncbi:MAG TPA: membrane dipeptidase [Chloroflexota bacterium]|nr:membrane dipeptidase [Chloroflexota bacterium]